MSHNSILCFYLVGSIYALVIGHMASKVLPQHTTPRFATKTAYRFVLNPRSHYHEKVVGCKAVHLNFVGRHGTRFPSESDVKKFDDLEKTINKLINNSSSLHPSVNLYIPWKNLFEAESASKLSTVGVQELFGIGERLAQSFPELIPTSLSSYDPTLYKFSSTYKERTFLSASAARIGLFKGIFDDATNLTHDMPVHQDWGDDPLLRYYKICPKYDKQVDNNEATLAELNKFVQSKEMKSVVEKVKRKLGLIGNNEITAARVQAMYKYCAFSTANNMASGFCSLFDKQDLMVLEYAEDLKYFYEKSTAYNITAKMSCPLLRDIMQGVMRSTGINKKQKNMVIRLGHSSTILTLLALMRIEINKVKPTADNFNQMTGRKFRTSVIAPFSSNVAVVLYSCGQKDYRVQVYLNERLVKVPCCQSARHCSFYDFVKCYMKDINSCDLEKICKV